MECHSCKQAAGKNQPDIIYVSHEKPNTISVDDIRTQLNNDIVIKPYSSKHKIYIVDEAEKMNQQAQNALLKTIACICGDPAFDHQCGEFSSDDLIPLCDAEFKGGAG